MGKVFSLSGTLGARFLLSYLAFVSATFLYVLLGHVNASRAAVIINTLNSGSPSGINKNGSASSGSFDAVMFELTSGSGSWDLNSVSLSMKTNGTTTTWIAGLFNSAIGNSAPSTFVADLGTATNTNTSFTNTTFTPLSPVTLADNNRYWIVFGNITGTGNQGAYQQSGSISNTGTGPGTIFPTLTIGRWRSANQNTLGLTTLAGINLNSGSTSTAAAPIFRVDASAHSAPAVPEPSSIAIFGLGALGFAYRNRRKLMK